MDKITISLTVQEWNVILGVLGARPYTEVAAIIANIREQGEPKASSGQNEES